MEIYSGDDMKVVKMADVAYLYSNKSSAEYQSLTASGSTSKGYSTSPEKQTVNGVEIVPEGTNNDLPIQTRNLLDAGHLGSGALSRMKGMIFAQGIGLYQTIYEKDATTGKTKIFREWQEDTEILEYLEQINAEKLIINNLEDLLTGGIYYNKLFRNVGGRLEGNTGVINLVEHVPAYTGRRGWPGSNGRTEIIYTGDWTGTTTAEPTKGYRRFDPLANIPATSMDFGMFYRFGMGDKMPSVPPFLGAFNWMKLGSKVPIILQNLTENSLNIRWHIKSPAAYWAEKGEKLKKQYDIAGKPYSEKVLEDFKEAVLLSLSSVLKGIDNVGGFFHSEKVLEVLDIGKAQVMEWEIEAIDMKVKDYIDAQIKIADKADQATTSGMGIHGSLSNIIINGRSASGSEELYAYKLFAANDTYITELIAFEVLNRVLRFNFPNKKQKAGIYREVVMKESEVTPSNREKNTEKA